MQDTSTGLKDFSLDIEANNEPTYKLSELTNMQLFELRAEIEQRLGPQTIEEVNLIKETLLQIHRGKALLEEATKKDSAVPMNQRAQVQNSLGSMLTQLAKMQMELYTSERVKRIQVAVIKVIKTLPKLQQDAFFEQLEYELGEAHKTEVTT